MPLRLPPPRRILARRPGTPFTALYASSFHTSAPAAAAGQEQSHYETLNLPESATRADIKKSSSRLPPNEEEEEEKEKEKGGADRQGRTRRYADASTNCPNRTTQTATATTGTPRLRASSRSPKPTRFWGTLGHASGTTAIYSGNGPAATLPPPRRAGPGGGRWVGGRLRGCPVGAHTPTAPRRPSTGTAAGPVFDHRPAMPVPVPPVLLLVVVVVVVVVEVEVEKAALPIAMTCRTLTGMASIASTNYIRSGGGGLQALPPRAAAAAAATQAGPSSTRACFSPSWPSVSSWSLPWAQPHLEPRDGSSRPRKKPSPRGGSVGL